MKAYKQTKSVIICLLLVLGFYSVKAQDDVGDMSYGPQVKLGINSWIGPESPTVDLDGVFTYGAGGFFKYKVIDILSVRAELGYLSYGAKNLEEGASIVTLPNQISQNSSVRAHSIEGALLAEVTLPFDIPFLPTIIAGPSLNYNFYAQASNEYLMAREGQSYVINTTSNVTDKYVLMETAANIGIGYSLDIAGYNTMIDARYRLGITPITSYPFRSPYAEEVYRSSVLLTISVTL